MEWTGARYADKPTAEVSTWIDAAPEDVWPVRFGHRADAVLSAELQSVEWCEAGPRRSSAGASTTRSASGRRRRTSSNARPRACSPGPSRTRTEPSAIWKFTLEPDNGGTRLSQWMQMGPGRSGLSFAIDRMPDKEQKIVFVRLREFETAMTGNLAAIKDRVENR